MDSNNDNVGDANLVGVLIKLLDSTGTFVIATTLTDKNGNYLFTDLAPGSYVVMETNLPVAPFDVSDIDGGDLNSIKVSIGGSDPLNSTGNNFVDEPSRTVRCFVLEDTNNDDVGNSPIPGVSGSLLDSSRRVVATTTSERCVHFRGHPTRGIYSCGTKSNWFR